MDICFKDGKLQKLCENNNNLIRKYGNIQAKKIMQRINELLSAENLYDISRLPPAGLHLLSNNYKGHFAVNLKQPFRLVLLPINGQLSDLKSINNVKIIIIINYHN